MTDAPEFLRDKFIRAVQDRDKDLFQHLLGKTGYLWGAYYHSLAPEDQFWAIVNRPISDSERHSAGSHGG